MYLAYAAFGMFYSVVANGRHLQYTYITFYSVSDQCGKRRGLQQYIYSNIRLSSRCTSCVLRFLAQDYMLYLTKAQLIMHPGQQPHGLGMDSICTALTRTTFQQVRGSRIPIVQRMALFKSFTSLAYHVSITNIIFLSNLHINELRVVPKVGLFFSETGVP